MLVTKGNWLLPVKTTWLGQEIELTIDFIADKKLIFVSFGDGNHFLTGGHKAEQVQEMNFNLTEMQLVDRSSGSVLDYPPIVVPNEQLQYKFVDT